MGANESAQRDGKAQEDAVADEESAKVDDVQHGENIDDKLLPKNGQISGLNGKSDDLTEEINGHCEDMAVTEVCQTNSAIEAPKEDIPETAETIKKEEAPLANDIDEKESPDSVVDNVTSPDSPADEVTSLDSPSDDVTLPELSADDVTSPESHADDVTSPDSPADDVTSTSTSESEVKLNEINESFKRFFSMVGLKLTLKKDTGEKTELSPEKEEGEASSPEDIKDSKKMTSDEAEQNIEQSTPQEPADNDSTSSPTTTDITTKEVKKPTEEQTTETTEPTESSDKVEPRDKVPADKVEPNKEVTSDKVEPSDKVPADEEESNKDVTSDKGAEAPATTTLDEEQVMSPIKRFFTQGIFSSLRKKKKPTEEDRSKDETVERELQSIGKQEEAGEAQEQVKEEISSGVETAPAIEGEQNENKLKVETMPTSSEIETESLPAETTNAPEFSDNRENVLEGQSAPEGFSSVISNEAELLSSQEKVKIQGSPLKKLLSGSGLKKLSRKHRGRKAAETKLTVSGEHVAEQLQSSSESAEYQRGESSASSPVEGTEQGHAPLESSHESEGDVNSDGERKRDGTWASFKKLVTPKKRAKRSSESEDEAAVEGDQGIELSTEEPKKKDSSWEAFLCGSGKRRSRKTSDSEEMPMNDDQKSNDEAGNTAESPLDTSQEGDYDNFTSSAENAGSPSEGDGGSTWKSLKRLVTPKRKLKTEEACKATSPDQIPSDSEISKDESSFSIKKLIPGRKKRKYDGKQEQISSDEADKGVGSDDEDSETPAVVPLSEYDTIESEEDHNLQTEALIDSSKHKAEEEETQQDLSSQVTELAFPNDPLLPDAGKVQDTNDTVAQLASSTTPTATEDFEDLTELISKHLSDIPEEGVIEESIATPVSPAEDTTRDDTIAEDMIELTSEAVTALEPIDDSLAEETTEMVSAVSQLTESSKTSGNTTPVPAEYDVKETEALLQEVVENICLTPNAVSVTTKDASLERVAVTVSANILETSNQLDDSLAEETTEMVSAVSQLTESSKTSDNATAVAAEYDVKETEALLQEVVENICVTPNALSIITKDVSLERVAVSVSPHLLERCTELEVIILEAHKQSDAVAICTGLGTKQFDDTDECPVEPQVESISEVSEAILTELAQEDKAKFDAARFATDELQQAEVFKPQEISDAGAISTGLESKEVDVSLESPMEHQVECISELSETTSTELATGDTAEEIDAAGMSTDMVHQAEVYTTETKFQKGSGKIDESQNGEFHEEQKQLLENNVGEVTQIMPIEDEEDKQIELVNELQESTPIHVATINLEKGGVQVNEGKVVVEDIPMPDTESLTVSVTDEPVIQPTHLTEVTLEVEKEQEMMDAEGDAVDFEHAQLAEIITCEVQDITASMPDTPIVEATDIPETLIAIVAPEVQSSEANEAVSILSPVLVTGMSETAELGNTIVMVNVPSVQFVDDHNIKVQVTDTEMNSTEAIVEAVLEVGSTEIIKAMDICEQIDDEGEAVSATLEIEDEIIEEASRSIAQELIQHEMENSPESSNELVIVESCKEKESVMLDQEVAMPPVDLIVEPQSDVRAESEIMSETEVSKAPEDTLAPETFTETNSQTHVEEHPCKSVESTITAVQEQENIQLSEELEFDSQQNVRNTVPSIVQVDTVCEDSKGIETFSEFTSEVVKAPDDIVPITLAETCSQQEAHKMETEPTVALEIHRAKEDSVTPEIPTQGHEKKLDKKKIESRQKSVVEEIEEEAEEKSTQTVASYRDEYNDTRRVSVEVKVSVIVQTPGNQTFVSQSIDQNPTQSIGNTRLCEDNQIVCTKEAIEPPSPVTDIEVFEVGVQTTEAVESKAKPEEENDQDVWLDAEEGITAKPVEYLAGQVSQEHEASETSIMDQEIAQDSHVGGGEESQQETLKADVTNKTEGEDAEDFAIALEPQGFLLGGETATETNVATTK